MHPKVKMFAEENIYDLGKKVNDFLSSNFVLPEPSKFPKSISHHKLIDIKYSHHGSRYSAMVIYE